MSLSIQPKNGIAESDKDLISQFLASKTITILPPAAAASNEACRATNELIARKRREHRTAQRLKNK